MIYVHVQLFSELTNVLLNIILMIKTDKFIHNNNLILLIKLIVQKKVRTKINFDEKSLEFDSGNRAQVFQQNHQKIVLLVVNEQVASMHFGK